LKKHFKLVKAVKPPASRQGSSEIYAFAKGFKAKTALADTKGEELRKEWADILK
jgi:hypothetical protein